MPIVVGHATVPANSTTQVYSLPPGYCNVTLWQATTSPVIYKGTSPHVSPTNGIIVPNTPLSQESYSMSAGATIYATSGTFASSFNYIIVSTGL